MADKDYAWVRDRRVAVFAERYPPQVGGVATSVARFCRALRAAGADVHVINRTDQVPPGLVETETSEAGNVHRFGLLSGMEDTLQMLESLVTALHEESAFSIVHAFWAVPSGYLAAWTGKQLGVPSYVSLRGNDVDRGVYSARQIPFLQWSLTHADAVSAVSTALRDKACLLSGRDDIGFVANSVDAETFKPGPAHRDTQALRADGSRLVGFVGELRLKKGMSVLLEAFRLARRERPLKLLIVGHLRRSDRPFYREFLKANEKLASEIIAVPYVEDRAELAAYYNALDLVVCPSLWEGMPNAVLEAMSCGRVVLASRTGGVPDVIDHGRDGFMVDRRTLDRLEEGILEVLALPEQARQQIGAAARRKVLEQFSPEREFAGHMAVYRRLLSLP